jgi:hypothetical protein
MYIGQGDGLARIGNEKKDANGERTPECLQESGTRPDDHETRIFVRAITSNNISNLGVQSMKEEKGLHGPESEAGWLPWGCPNEKFIPRVHVCC